MQYKSKIFSFELEIYKAEIIIFHGCTVREVQKYFDKNLKGVRFERKPEWCAMSFICMAENGYEVYCIDFTFPLKLKSAADHNTIVHEAFHTLCKIFEARGIELDYEEQEVFTYPLGFIVEKINAGLFF